MVGARPARLHVRGQRSTCDAAIQERGRCPALCPPLHSAQHLSSHDEVGGYEHQRVRGGDPMRGEPASGPEVESGAATLELTQDEDPRPGQLGTVAVTKLRRKVRTRVQHEVPAGLEPPNDEVAVALGWSVRHGVPDREPLPLGMDPLGRRLVGREQQHVHPPRGVPAPAVPSHLQQPGPNLLRRRVDGDGMIGDEVGPVDEFVTGKRFPPFLPRRPGSSAEPLKCRVGDC